MPEGKEKPGAPPLRPAGEPEPGFVSWYGGVYRRRDLLRTGGGLMGPPLAWLLFFLALPCLGLAALSLARRGDYGEVIWAFSLENYRRLLGYGLFGWSPDHLLILGRSLWVGLATTIICLLLAYPLTFYIATRPPRLRSWLLLLLTAPFWINVAVRTYAWMIFLSPGLPPARLAAFLGLIPADGALFPGEPAVFLGLVSAFLPFMALPLYASVERLDWELLEAARDLYAGRWDVFRRVILPQTRPGLTVGVIVTFVPAMAMFVVTDLLGGARYMLVGNLIQNQFGPSRDWPFGAALCLSLMALTLAGLAWYRRREGARGEIF